MINSNSCFHAEMQKLFEELGDHAVGALATCFDSKPYVRSVSCVFQNEKIYFQSDRTMQKAIHINENPFVSVCFQHIQIQGICTELESPLHPRNGYFLQLFKEHFPRAAQRYSHLDNERVYQIVPTKIETWRYINGIPYQEMFDVDAKLYISKQYEI